MGPSPRYSTRALSLLVFVFAFCTFAVAAEELPLLDPLTQPQFQVPLPRPAVLTPDTSTYPGVDYYQVSMTQFPQHLGLIDPGTGHPMATTVWGYGGTYPGPTIEASSTLDSGGRPVRVKWMNQLVNGAGQPLPHLLPVDPTLHCGPGTTRCAPYNRTVTHLHGGHTESASDGYPEAWFTPGFTTTGPHFVKPIYHYDNDQPGATLWYHDHALGITRLNVYAGLAGFYLLRDDLERWLIANHQLPDRAYEIPLAIQDRSFYVDGSLAYPAGEPLEEPESDDGTRFSSLEPEAFGDFILVNGAVWPVLEVEPRVYRFRVLNGSDSRFYNLWLDSGTQFVQIGSDGGFLDGPVVQDRFVIAPGERADVLVDFSDPRLAGATILLRNNARAPFPRGETVNPRTTGRVMAFKVVLPKSGVADTSKMPSLRATPIERLLQSGASRELVLVENIDEHGRLLPQLGTVQGGPMMWGDPVTENPQLNDVEIWSVINTTPDTHPIHLHLVQFQVLDRQRFMHGFVPGNPATLRMMGRPMPPDANEAGWKDTVQVPPGTVTRLIAQFDREGFYVWHCHILAHEDHDMMRPLVVGPIP